MESALLGLVLDSSVVIEAERKRQPITDFIEAILTAHGPVDLSLPPVTVAELVHGILLARTPEASRRRREYIEELVSLVPVDPSDESDRLAGGKDRGAGSCQGKRAAL